MIKTSLIIVDDHVLVSNGIANLIANFENYTVLYECTNGKQMVQKFEDKNNIPSIVLLDVNMPVMDGFETALWLKENHPEVLILAISFNDDEKVVLQMIKYGAGGYILKNEKQVGLKIALDNMVAHKHYFPDWITTIMSANLSKTEEEQTRERKIIFSEREKVFLKHCVSEMNYKEISDIMCCSPRTIESYRDNLFVKLNLKSRTGLAVYAVKNGFA